MRGVKGTGPRHGTHGSYVKGCRCPICREAHAIYARQLRQSRSLSGYVPVERVLPLVEFLERVYGTLVAAEEAAGFGVNGSRFSAWKTGRYRYVQKSSADRVVRCVAAHRRPANPLAEYDTERRRLPLAVERDEARREFQAADRKKYRDRARAKESAA